MKIGDELSAETLDKLRKDTLFTEESLVENNYIIKIGMYDYLVQRNGECKRCGKCCKFMHVALKNKYYDGFGVRGTFGVKIPIKCKHCTKGNNCKIFDHPEFPGACKQFPHIDDQMYYAIEKTCGFRFVIVDKSKVKK